MKLTYIYHSGFVIETDTYVIIIDYYRDAVNGVPVVSEQLLDCGKKLYVLASHSHADHFNLDILTWRKKGRDIAYIFSADIRTSVVEIDKDDILFIDKGETYNDNNLQVKAFGSTDLGISFSIKTDNKTIFHAGDLNNWHWNEESTEQNIKEAEDFYQRELNEIAASTPAIDIALFPVDPRLGKDYMKGAEQFIQSIPIGLFVPMHFDAAYEKATAIETITLKYDTKVFTPSHAGDYLLI